MSSSEEINCSKVLRHPEGVKEVMESCLGSVSIMLALDTLVHTEWLVASLFHIIM